MPVLPVLPLKDAVIFPQIVNTLGVGRRKSLAAVSAASESGREMIAVAQKVAANEDPGIDDLYQVACVCTINRVEKRDGGVQLVVQGSHRVKLLAVTDESEFIAIEYQELPVLGMDDLGDDAPSVDATLRENLRLAQEIAKIMDRENGIQIYQQMVGSISDPIIQMYRIASLAPGLTLEQRQSVLEASSTLALMETIHELMGHEHQVTELRVQIAEAARGDMDQQQREHVLRQQKHAIEQALGEAGDDDDIAELKGELDEAKLPEAIRTEVDRELKRLARMSANAADYQGRFRTDSENVLDQYILAKTRDLVSDLTTSMDAYDLFGACQRVREYLDVLTNWYVRRSRSRFWAGDETAIDTMHTVMSILVRLTAPLLPLISEAINDGLNSGSRVPGASVHLADWPTVDELPENAELVAAMDLVRDVCSATLSVRKAHQRRVRLPLNSLVVATPEADRLTDFVDVIAEEVNVRRVDLTDDVASVAAERLQLVPARLGPRLGKEVQQVIKAHKSGDWSVVDGHVTVGGQELLDGEYTLELVAEDDKASAGLANGGGVVALDVDVTEELEVEGRARDLVRLIQQARRDADLDVSDRIELSIAASELWIEAAIAHESLISGETLATKVSTEVVQKDESGEPTIIVNRVQPA